MSRRGGSPRDDPIIKLRGLPYEATALDLCKFFTECKIKGGPRGIYFTLNDRKQPTGEVYVELETFRDVDLALRRNRDRMGTRYIEVFEARRSQLDREIRDGATNEFGFNENRKDRGRLSDRFDRYPDFGRDAPVFGRGGFGGDRGFGRDRGFGGFGGDRGFDFDRGFGRERGFGRDRDFGSRDSSRVRDRSRDRGPPRSEASKHCVKLRGLPWSATKEDIVDFLPDCNILGGSSGVFIIMEEGKDRPTGDAYVEMDSADDVTQALKQHKKNLGSRYVEVFEAVSRDVARAKDKEASRRVLKEGFSVNLRGLPYSCTEKEIIDWLKDAAEPIEVIISEDRRGRPSGQATAYFKTEKEAKTVAKEMHKRDMGSRYIECFYDGADRASSPDD